MAQQQIWVEGYPKPYTNAKAVLLATIENDSFHGACIDLIKQDEMFGKYFDKRTHTFMGCKICATEEKARSRWG